MTKLQSNSLFLINKGDMKSLLTKMTSPNASLGLEGQHERYSRMTKVNGKAVIDICGPLVTYSDWFTYCGYGTSYDEIFDCIQEANADAMISSILFRIDSPGGESNGLDELCQYVRSNPKPIESFVAGTAASAAFWLACASQRIYSARMGWIGSVGAIICVMDWSKALEEMGIQELTFVSSVSPKKAYDPTTEQGKESIQKLVDVCGNIFVDRVSEYRNKERDIILTDFGQGEIVIATEAIKVGMIDEVSDLASVIASSRSPEAGIQAKGEKLKMSLGLTTPKTSTEEDMTEEEKAEAEKKAKAEKEKQEAEAAAQETPPEDDKEKETKSKSEKPNGEDYPEDEDEEVKNFIQKNPKLAQKIKASGVSSERSRLQGIDKLEAAFPYHKSILIDAKYKTPMSPEKAALACAEASVKNKNQHIQNLNNDSDANPSIGDLSPKGKNESIDTASVTAANKFNKIKRTEK